MLRGNGISVRSNDKLEGELWVAYEACAAEPPKYISLLINSRRHDDPNLLIISLHNLYRSFINNHHIITKATDIDRFENGRVRNRAIRESLEDRG